MVVVVSLDKVTLGDDLLLEGNMSAREETPCW